MAKSNPSDKDLIADLARFTRDPYRFVLYAFPWGEGELSEYAGPDEEQTKWLKDLSAALQSTKDPGIIIREALASGHGIGKSARVSWLILWAMSTFEDTKGVVTANTETQLKTKTWAELAKWHRLFIAKHWFTFTATALFSADPSHEKTWRVDMVPWSERNTEAFAGLHNKGKRILLIFDEASAIHDAIWEVSEGALTDSDTEIIWCAFGNPTRSTGRFRECFRKFARRWHAIHVDSRNSRFTNKDQIQEWIDDYGEDSDFVKIRVRGLFPTTSAGQYYSEKDVDAAYGKHLREEQYNFAPKILTLDPAWQGDDTLEFGLRQGLVFQHLLSMPYNDNDIVVAQKLAQFEDDHGADAVFIDAGYGTGIVSAGRTWDRNWQLVWFAGESSDPGCLNKRAEMAKKGKQWLKQGGAFPPDTTLREEVLGIETVPRVDGKIQLESKKEYKKRLNRSPGRFDSWLLSFAFPVTKRLNNGPLGTQQNQVVTEYDIFAN